MAQVIDSPISSPLSTRSVLSISIGSDPRLALPSNRGGGSGNAGSGAVPLEVDPFAFHDSEDDDNNNNEEEKEENDEQQQQPESYISDLLLMENNSSQFSFKSHASGVTQAHSQEVLTQNTFTQMTQDANEAGSLSQSPIPPPRSPTMLLQIPWGRLMPVHDDNKKVDLLPKAPEDTPAATTSTATASGGASPHYYSILGLEQLKPSDLFNSYTLGRSHKCHVIANKPKLKQQQRDNNNSNNKEQRLHEWAYGLISNRHCRIYCTLPDDPTRVATTTYGGSSSNANNTNNIILPPASLEVWVEDSSNNGTMINGGILLKRGQKRRLHSGDEISLVNTETLRKKVRDTTTLQQIQQQHSYVFVNVTSQQQSTTATTTTTAKFPPPKVAVAGAPPIPGNIFPIPQSGGGGSGGKRRKGLVNVRAMNYPPGSRSPLPAASAHHHRSPRHSELDYGFAQPTPKSSGSNYNNNSNSFRRPAAAAAATMARPSPPPPSPRRIEQDYDIRDLLGRGTCGEVRRAIHRQTGKERAVKIISLPSPGLLSHHTTKQQEQWQKEAEILRGLKHPYIVDLVDVFCTEAHLYLVMELSSGGDLFDRIVKQTKYSETNSRRVMRRLLSALHYIHEDCQLVHRDLKPENILLSSANDPCDVKITDFGVAKSASSELKTFCGTPSYIAPEVLKRRHTVMAQGRYGKSADMWSLGVILYILLSGTPPYNIDGARGMDVILQSSLKIEFPDRHWSTISGQAKDLVNKLLIKDPLKRIAVQQAMEHPWILMEDGDTHRHPLEDPKLIAVTRKRLFSPVPANGPTPVTSSASLTPPPRKPKAKKRKVSMEKSEVVRPSTPSGLAMAPIQRPLSPVENRCSSPSFSPPASPSGIAKRMVEVAKVDNENDENRASPVNAEPLAQSQQQQQQQQRRPPIAVTDTKAKRQPKEKEGLVKAAELEEDKICSQFSDEDLSISSFGKAISSVANRAKVGQGSSTLAAPKASRPKANLNDRETKATSSSTSSSKAKKSKSSSGTSDNKSAKRSKSSEADGSKQATLARWFQPINKRSS